MKTIGFDSFRVLDVNSLELADNNSIVLMNNETRTVVVNYNQQIDLVLPESTPNNKVIQIISHGGIATLVRVYPFGTTEAEIGTLTGLLAEINGIYATTLTLQFLNGVTYVTKSVGNSDVVETEVSFTFAQIRAMGTTPLQLLVNPGAGKYNDISGFTQEYKHVGVPYTAATATAIYIKEGSIVKFAGEISQLTDGVSSFINYPISYNRGNSATGTATQLPLDTALTATTDDASNLTLGTGTLKFITLHKIRTVV